MISITPFYLPYAILQRLLSDTERIRVFVLCYVEKVQGGLHLMKQFLTKSIISYMFAIKCYWS